MSEQATLLEARPRFRCRFFAGGIPKPQPRARAFARKLANGATVARVFDDGTAESWKSQIADAVRSLLPPVPLETAIAVELAFFLPRPKSLMRARDPDGPMPHTGRVDCDNLAKAVLDCITQLGLWRDDGQVCELAVSKRYTGKTERPGAWITVEELTE